MGTVWQLIPGGNAYVSGHTNSTNFPIVNAIQSVFGGGSFDAFVAKLNDAGSALIFSTYLGGSGLDVGIGVAVDTGANAYVTGFTDSAAFPRATPFQANLMGAFDGYVAKIIITPPNQPPLANSQSVSTPGNTPLAITLTGSDPDGDLLTFAIVMGSSHGTLSGTPPNVTYTPNLNFVGWDTFIFKTRDGKVDSPAAKVSIRVSDDTPPLIGGPAIVGTLGTNGWYTSDAIVSWTVNDPESGIASSTGCGSVTLTASSSVHCTATNGAGLSTSAPILNVKIDKTPPALSGMPAPGCTLWPPNSKLVEVAAISASDLVSGPASFSVTVDSNEPASPGPDFVIIGTELQSRTVQLRAERLGNGNGRVYRIAATAIDVAGNSVNATALCTVARSRN